MATLQPIDPSAPAADPALGAFITTRKKGLIDKIVYLTLIAIATLGALLALVAAVGQVTEGNVLNALIVAAVAAGVLALCFLGFRALFRTVSFHEYGALEQRFSRRRTFMYADAEGMRFGVTRQYVNGIYAGTSLSLKIVMTDGRKLTFGGRYKEKPKGFSWSIFGRTFEGQDEIDVVRDVIAANIAKRMMSRVQSEGSVAWMSGVQISLEGLTSRGGRRKNQLVSWREIAGFRIESGFAHIFAAGDTKSFITLHCGGHNFFPGWQLVASFMEAHAAPEPAAAS